MPVGCGLKDGGANGFGDADIWVVVVVDGRFLDQNAIESIPVGFLDNATSLEILSVLRRGPALGICMRVVGIVSVLGLMIPCVCVFGFFAAVYFDGRLCDGPGAVMNERDCMDDVCFFESVDYRLGVD